MIPFHSDPKEYPLVLGLLLLGKINSFDNNVKFTHESNKGNATGLDLTVKL